MKNTLLAVAIACLAAPALAQDKAANPSLDDLLDIKPPKPANDTTKPKPPKPVGDIKVAPTPEREPFKAAITEMQQAASRLGKSNDAGLGTQRLQESAVKRLDQLISELRKQQQQQQSSSSSSGNPQQDSGSQQNQQKPGQQPGQQNKPGQEQGSNQQDGSNPANGPGGRGGRPGGAEGNEPLAERLAEWGSLPPRLREQLMQGLDDPFSKLYRRLTERYFQRLAEENE